jgi:hypothetical protein
MVEVRKFSAPMVSLERCMTGPQIKKVKADGVARPHALSSSAALMHRDQRFFSEAD